MPASASKQHWRDAYYAEGGVTPVIGTVLVLAVTVTGIGVALFLGTPTIQQLRDQAALETVVGQMHDVRHAANSMSVPGTTRLPALSLPAGVVSLQPGTTLTVKAGSTASTVVTLTIFAGDVLEWSQGPVASYYELGGILSTDHGRSYVAAMPLVEEGTRELYLRMPELHAQYGALSGGGDHAVQLSLGSLSSFTTQAAVFEFAFAGPRATEWCEAFRIRNALVPLSSPSYSASGAPAAGTGCTSVFFTGGPGNPITLYLTRVEIRASLQV